MADRATDGADMTGSTTTMLTAHELALLAEARDWVRDGAWSSAMLEPVTTAVGAALDRAVRLPAVARVAQRATDALVDGLDDALDLPTLLDGPAATATTPDERVALLDAGDEHAEQVRQRHVGRTAARGAVTGAMSSTWIGAAAGLAADVSATTLDQARAVAEVLAGYGLREDLRATALATLALAGERDPERRRTGLLAAAGFTAHPSPGVDELGDVLAEQTGARLLTDLVERVVRVRVRQRAAGVVPVLGAAAGAVTGATMTGRACDVARHVGRLRVLRTHAELDGSALGLPAGPG